MNDQPHSRSFAREEDLPFEVRALCPRMRQIATHVYEQGGATVKEVQAGIAEAPSIPAVRTMLLRLVRKGILRRRSSGRHMSTMFLPGLLTKGAEDLAIRSLVRRHFQDCAPAALQLVLQMMSSNDSREKALIVPTDSPQQTMQCHVTRMSRSPQQLPTGVVN